MTHRIMQSCDRMLNESVKLSNEVSFKFAASIRNDGSCYSTIQLATDTVRLSDFISPYQTGFVQGCLLRVQCWDVFFYFCVIFFKQVLIASFKPIMVWTLQTELLRLPVAIWFCFCFSFFFYNFNCTVNDVSRRQSPFISKKNGMDLLRFFFTRIFVLLHL